MWKLDGVMERGVSDLPVKYSWVIGIVCPLGKMGFLKASVPDTPSDDSGRF